MSAREAMLLAIDLQERLVPALDGGAGCVAAAARLVRAARLLDRPVLATEHMPERIGSTVPALRGLLAPEEIVRKTHFSAMGEPGFRGRIARHARPVALCGAEAHVCVMQTALALLRDGREVLLVEDACAARMAQDRAAALRRLRAAGAIPATSEMLIFEWLERGDAPAFREALAIIKERPG